MAATGTPTHRALLPVVALVLLLAGAAGCGRPPAPPPGPPHDAACAWSPPPADPTVAAPTCGVAATDVVAAIPRHADLLPVTAEFFVADARSCAPATGCVVGDARDHLVAPTTDPRADPSRRRGLLTFDWANDRLTLHLAPRCVLAPDGRTQRCTTIPASGVRLALDAAGGTASPWHLRLTSTVPGPPDWSEHWNLALDPSTAQLTVDGDGSDAPDVALSTGDDVPCAAPAVPAPAPRHVACTLAVPANP